MVRLFNRQSHWRCQNNIPIGREVDCFLEVIVTPPLEGFALGYGRFNNILFSAPTNRKQYEVTIENFWTCISLGFVSVVASLLDQWGKWVFYKHLYYELQDVMFCGEFEIHFPTWSCDEVCHLLDCAIWKNVKRCITWDNINDFNLHYKGLVLAMSWDFFKNVLKHVQYLI
jgi:hypothetical protein